MDIAMTKGFAASTDTISIDANSDDKEILEFIKKNNLDIKKLEDLIENSINNNSKNDPTDLTKDPRPVVQKILSFMEKEKIDIKEMEIRAGLGRSSLRVFLYSGLSNNMKILNMVKLTNLMNLSLDDFILDTPIPMNRKKDATNEEIEHTIKSKILDFLKENKISKTKLEKTINANNGAIRKLYHASRTKIPQTSSLISLAQVMQCSLESFLPNK